MQIQCILKREGGTQVDLPGRKYHFAPQADGKHVAEVEDPAHIATLLAIKEAYRMVGAPDAQPVSAVAHVIDPGAEGADEIDTTILLGSDNFPATFDIHGKTYQLGAIVARAQKDSGLDGATWNELTADQRDIKIEQVLDGLEDGEITDVPDIGNAPVATAATPIDTAIDPLGVFAAPPAVTGIDPERAALNEQYKAKFGKNPPSNMKTESIIAKLAE